MARSLQVWVIYTTVVGALLLFIPNVLLGLFQIEETTEVWVRVLGLIVLVLTVMYAYTLRVRQRTMYQGTVYARWLAVVGLTVLAFTSGPWQLVLFAVVDLAGSIWTHLANQPD